MVGDPYDVPIWWVVWNMAFMTFHSVGNGIMIPTDEVLIVFRGVGRKTTKQVIYLLFFLMFFDLYSVCSSKCQVRIRVFHGPRKDPDLFSQGHSVNIYFHGNMCTTVYTYTYIYIYMNIYICRWIDACSLLCWECDQSYHVCIQQSIIPLWDLTTIKWQDQNDMLVCDVCLG